VVIAVPIEHTERVIREVGAHVRDDALLMDITSIKSAPVDAMLGRNARQRRRHASHVRSRRAFAAGPAHGDLSRAR
jgi:prephenate dehydrogenase